MKFMPNYRKTGLSKENLWRKRVRKGTPTMATQSGGGGGDVVLPLQVLANDPG